MGQKDKKDDSGHDGHHEGQATGEKVIDAHHLEASSPPAPPVQFSRQRRRRSNEWWMGYVPPGPNHHGYAQ